MLYYPEPQFFRHRNETYIRNAHANWREDTSHILDLFNIDKGNLIPGYSFVPCGLAQQWPLSSLVFMPNDADLYPKPLTYSGASHQRGLLLAGFPNN